jgi:hypothetical protein
MENYFMLDGKKVPMSDETVKDLRKKQESKIPMVRTGVRAQPCVGYGENRVIIRFTEEMKRVILDYPTEKTFVFDEKGNCVNHWHGYDGQRLNVYNNVKTVFEGDLE